MTDTWIKFPYGGPGAGFPMQALIDHIHASGRSYVIQGQTHCTLAEHPKPQSLDAWLRRTYTGLQDTAQAVNQVIEELASTGSFCAGKFVCPDSGQVCKGVELLD